MSFLDCNGALIPYSYEPWKDEGKRESKQAIPANKLKFEPGLTLDSPYLPSILIETPTKGTSRMSPTLNQESSFGDRQFMVITSEKQCRIVALPSQNCVYRLQITETDFVVRAEIVSMKGTLIRRSQTFSFFSFSLVCANCFRGLFINHVIKCQTISDLFECLECLRAKIKPLLMT